MLSSLNSINSINCVSKQCIAWCYLESISNGNFLFNLSPCDVFYFHFLRKHERYICGAENIWVCVVGVTAQHWQMTISTLATLGHRTNIGHLFPFFTFGNPVADVLGPGTSSPPVACTLIANAVNDSSCAFAATWPPSC